MAAVKPGRAKAADNTAILSNGFIFDTAPYPEAHASTIAETTAGDLVASWFGGTRERNPDVEIWVARFEGGRWSTGVSVADGVQADGTRHPT